MREPVVAGVSGGVGARTVAVALAGLTAPPGRHAPCDVLVCRATVVSVGLAERHLVAVPGRPVLAVVVDVEGVPRPVAAKLKMLAPHAAGMVRLPWVSRWREIATPYAEATQLAFQQPQSLPKHLRGYATAVAGLVPLVRPLLAMPLPSAPAAPGAIAVPDPRTAFTGAAVPAAHVQPIPTTGGH